MGCVGKKLDRVEQNKREQRLIQYRQMGYSDGQIMAMENYSSLSAANRAINKAMAKHDVHPVKPHPEDVRAEVDSSNAFLREQLLPLILKPPAKQSAIGRLTADPDTCKCSQRLNPVMDQHEPWCPVEPVRDESARIRAIDVYRKLGDQRTDLHGATRREIREDLAMAQVREYLARLPRYDVDGQVLTVEVIGELPEGDSTPGTGP